MIHLSYIGPRIVNIGKNHGGAAENAVFKGHSFINTHIILDFTAFSNGNIRTDDYILSDVTPFTDLRARHDVRKVPNFGSGTNLNTIVNDCAGMSEEVSRIRDAG